MVTLSITKPLQLKTADGIIERKPGEQLHVNDVVFAVTLHAAGKACISSDVNMVELMGELLRIDHVTDSNLYLNERISGSAAIVSAYRAGTKAQFIEQAVALIGLYLKCQKGG
jgi:hypothetical protein